MCSEYCWLFGSNLLLFYNVISIAKVVGEGVAKVSDFIREL